MAIEDLLSYRNFFKTHSEPGGIMNISSVAFHCEILWTNLNPGQSISQACWPVCTSKAQLTVGSNILYWFMRIKLYFHYADAEGVAIMSHDVLVFKIEGKMWFLNHIKVFELLTLIQYILY